MILESGTWLTYETLAIMTLGAYCAGFHDGSILGWLPSTARHGISPCDNKETHESGSCLWVMREGLRKLYYSFSRVKPFLVEGLLARRGLRRSMWPAERTWTSNLVFSFSMCLAHDGDHVICGVYLLSCFGTAPGTDVLQHAWLFHIFHSCK